MDYNMNTIERQEMLIDEFQILTMDHLYDTMDMDDREIFNYFTMKLCAEAGEFANLAGKSEFGTYVESEDYEDELADTLIFLRLLERFCGYNLEAALERKLLKFKEKLEII